MTDLTNLISAAVAEKMTPEFIEKEVNTRVEKLVIESINNALRSYSDTGKLIEAAVSEALRVERLDLPSYGSTVTTMLKAQIEALVAPVIAGKLAEDMADLLHLAPKEIKLSKIAEGMIERYQDCHNDAYGECITVIVEHTEYGSAWLYLDEDTVLSGRDKYSAKCRIGIDKGGKIFSATLAGCDIKSSQQLGRGHGLEQLVRAFYACGTVIEIDEGNVCTGVGDY